MGMSKKEFNRLESQRRKILGMELAADANLTALEYAKRLAVKLARKHPEHLCTADDVGRELARQGKESSLGPAAGSLFNNEWWEFTGMRRRSVRVSNHAREIKVWRLKDDYRL